MLEVIRSPNLLLKIAVPIYTITIDKSPNVSMVMKETRMFHKIYTNMTTAKLICREFTYKIEPEEDEQLLEQIYHVTHLVNGKPMTEEVVREGCGYSTTAREKAINDAREARNMKILEEKLAESLNGMKLPPPKK